MRRVEKKERKGAGTTIERKPSEVKAANFCLVPREQGLYSVLHTTHSAKRANEGQHSVIVTICSYWPNQIPEKIGDVQYGVQTTEPRPFPLPLRFPSLTIDGPFLIQQDRQFLRRWHSQGGGKPPRRWHSSGEISQAVVFETRDNTP